MTPSKQITFVLYGDARATRGRVELGMKLCFFSSGSFVNVCTIGHAVEITRHHHLQDRNGRHDRGTSAAHSFNLVLTRGLLEP
jgi:hypothetical protein